MRVRLDLAYVGTRYVGWQKQSSGESVQSTIENVLKRLYTHAVKVTGAGRTDSGVHAAHQVAHFETERLRPAVSELSSILNKLLPGDISVLKAAHVSDTFHARKSAVERTYVYRILTTPVPDPFRAPYVWHHPAATALSLEKMRKASKRWIGRHDFSRFGIRLEKYESTRRHMKRIEIRKARDEIQFTFVADAFLHRMVRRMVAYFVDVGSGMKISSPRFAAPASGLCLMKVSYR